MIELLVASSILALLLALLVPSLRTARSDAMRVVCLSNIRCVGLGVGAYAQDHFDWLPPCAQRYDGRNHPNISATVVRMNDVGYDLAAILGRYVGPRALSCPAPSQVPVTSPANRTGVVYSNYVFVWGSVGDTPVSGAARLANRDDLLAVADFTWYNINPASGLPAYGGNHAKPWARRRSVVETDCELNPSATQFVHEGTPVFLRGMNGVRLSGAAGWYPRRPGSWRRVGPYNRATAGKSAVYLPYQ